MNLQKSTRSYELVQNQRAVKPRPFSENSERRLEKQRFSSGLSWKVLSERLDVLPTTVIFTTREIKTVFGPWSRNEKLKSSLGQSYDHENRVLPLTGPC